MPNTNVSVVYFSGSRADYALMVSILNALEKEKRVNLSMVVAHMHLDKRFGLTIKQIKKDGFKIIGKIKTKINDSSEGMLSEFQVVIKKLPQILLKSKPDFLLIQGDRVESLAATTVAFLLKIPVIHVSGGCITGSMDNGFRWAITQLSSWHFPATKTDAQRIIKTGKSAKTVFLVGEPGLDVVLNMRLENKKELWKKFNLSLDKKLFLVIFHPDTAEKRYSPQKQIQPLLEFLEKSPAQVIQVYPNADTGGLMMRQMIDIKAKEKTNWQRFENLDHRVLLGLFKYTNLVIGNSSGAIVETPSFKIPVINIGKRQAGRVKTENIIEVGYERLAIERAVKKAMSKKFFKKTRQIKNPYGDGTAADKFMKFFKRQVVNL